MLTFEQTVPEMEAPVEDASYSINPGHALLEGQLRVISTFREIHTVLYAREANDSTIEIRDLNERAKAAAIHTVRDLSRDETIVAKIFADRDAREIYKADSEIAASIALKGVENLVPLLGAKRITVAGTERRAVFYDFVSGGRMDEYVRRKGPFSIEDAAVTTAGLAWALQGSHYRGIAHRDVTPFNVLRQAGTNTWLLGDLSIAQRTMREQDTEGSQQIPKRIWHKIEHDEFPEFGLTYNVTPYHSAPERIGAYRSGTLEQEDAYGLGMVVHFMLTGENPFVRGKGLPWEDWGRTVAALGTSPPSMEKLRATNAPEQIIDFVESSLGVPQNRPSTDDAIALFRAT